MDDTSLFVLSESRNLEDLPDEIKEHIIDATTEDDYTHRDGQLHVTELVYCLRKAYFRRQMEKEGQHENKALKDRWYLYRGIVFDEAWTSLFPRNQVRVTYRIPNGPSISGRIDFETEDTVWELKTVSNDYAIRDGPKPAHVKQALFYAWVENMPKAKLVYVHLGGVKIFELDTSRAGEVVDELVSRAKELYRALKEGRPPEPHNEPWECRYCPFRDLCEKQALDKLPL